MRFRCCERWKLLRLIREDRRRSSVKAKRRAVRRLKRLAERGRVTMMRSCVWRRKGRAKGGDGEEMNNGQTRRMSCDK